MEERMLKMSSRIAMLSLPRATMSRACTNGTPAPIMVANWREKMAMSTGRIFCLRLRAALPVCFLIAVGLMP